MGPRGGNERRGGARLHARAGGGRGWCGSGGSRWTRSSTALKGMQRSGGHGGTSGRVAAGSVAATASHGRSSWRWKRVPTGGPHLSVSRREGKGVYFADGPACLASNRGARPQVCGPWRLLALRGRGGLQNGARGLASTWARPSWAVQAAGPAVPHGPEQGSKGEGRLGLAERTRPSRPTSREKERNKGNSFSFLFWQISNTFPKAI